MALCAEIVADEIRYCRTLRREGSVESLHEYARLSSATGRYTPLTDRRVQLVEDSLVDLYYFFCYHYGITPDAAVAPHDVDLVSPERRCFLVEALLTYVKDEYGSTGLISLEFLNRVRRLRILQETLELLQTAALVQRPIRPGYFAASLGHRYGSSTV